MCILYMMMDDFIVIGWPEIQKYMELEGFEENTALITPNPYLGIDSSTYLVDKNWYNSIELN